jgi:hypothetical protein
MRDNYQDQNIANLQQALQMERAERLAAAAQLAQERMAWLLKRADRRLDPTLSDIATTRAR